MKSLASAPSGARAFLAGWLALAVTFAAVGWRLLRPPAPLAASAPPTEFSADRAEAVLKRLLGDARPRPTGSAANAEARERVLLELRSLGLDPQVQEAFACSRSSCATVRNVLARIDGRSPGPAVLVATHYDSVGAGPGVSDDLASVAATFEVARALVASPRPERPVVLLIDDGEEIGLLGARAFVAEHPWAGEIGVVVNLEARGTGGPSYLFETSADNGWLLEAFARGARRPATSSIFYSIYRRLPNDTDFTVFKAHGLAGVNFAFIGAVPRYHTPLDDLAHLDRRSLQHQGENALAAVRGLAAGLASAGPDRPLGEGAVYFDVFAARVVRWPIAWTLPIALAALLALLLATRAAARSERDRSGLRPLSGGIDLMDRVSLGSALLGGFGAVVSLAAAWGSVRGALWLIGRLGALPVEFPATRVWLTALAWTLGALATVVVGRWFARRAGPRGFWSGWWFLLALVGIALAVAEPSAAYVAILPALAAGLAAIYGILRFGGRGVASPLAIVVPVVTGAIVTGPFAWAVDHALGVPILPVVAVLAAILVLPLLPAVGLIERWWRSPARWVPVILGVASIALGTLAAVLPQLSADLPERLSIRLHRDASAGTSHWTASPESGVLPAALAGAGGFGAERERPWPWSTMADGFRAPAGDLGADLEAPSFEALPAPSGTVRARLRSPRGAPLVGLTLPPEAASRIEMVRLGGRSFTPVGKREIAAGAWRPFLSWTTPPEGIELELVFGPGGPGGPFEAVLYDQTVGLPPAATPVLRARPATAVPSGWGDATVVSRRVTIDGTHGTQGAQ